MATCSVLFIHTHLPAGHVLRDQRLDETEAGEGTTITLIDAHRTGATDAQDLAAWLGLAPSAAGLLAWDVFDAVLTPGDLILLLSWRDHTAAEAFERSLALS